VSSDDDGDSETRPRLSSVATLLTSLCPGLGYLYIGEFGAGLLANALFVGLLTVFVLLWTLLEFFPILPGFVLLLVWLLGTIYAARDVRGRIAERREPYALKSYNHWTIYSAVYLVGYLLPLAAICVGTASFFWTTAPVESTAMYPNLAPGDTALIRKSTVSGESLGPGDPVAVRSSPDSKYRMLRIVAAGPTEVRRAANNIEVGERTLPRIPLESVPESKTASASAAPPIGEFRSPPAPEQTSSEETRDDGDGNRDRAERSASADDYELMVERNASAKYVISIRPAANAKPSFDTFELAEDQYFLLADNRSAPDRQTGEVEVRDSRVFGPVRRDAIVGRPMFIAWSTEPSTGSIRWDRVGLRIR